MWNHDNFFTTMNKSIFVFKIESEIVCLANRTVFNWFLISSKWFPFSLWILLLQLKSQRRKFLKKKIWIEKHWRNESVVLITIATVFYEENHTVRSSKGHWLQHYIFTSNMYECARHSANNPTEPSYWIQY